MIQPLVTFGLVAVVGGLSLCDLCVPAARSVGTSGGLVSVADAAPVQRPPVRPLADTQVPVDAAARAVTRPAVTQPASARRTVTFAVQGMTCGGCEIGTRKVLTRLPGVAKADVSYEKGTAVVTYDPAKVTVEQMIAAVKTLGYTATVVAPPAR